MNGHTRSPAAGNHSLAWSTRLVANFHYRISQSSHGSESVRIRPLARTFHVGICLMLVIVPCSASIYFCESPHFRSAPALVSSPCIFEYNFFQEAHILFFHGRNILSQFCNSIAAQSTSTRNPLQHASHRNRRIQPPNGPPSLPSRAKTT